MDNNAQMRTVYISHVNQLQGNFQEKIAEVVNDGVKIIEEGAFFKCAQIVSVDIPNSVTSIGYGAFRNCTGLRTIDMVAIPNSVTSIGLEHLEIALD